MNDASDWFWPVVETAEAVFPSDGMDAGSLGALQQSGFVRFAGTASRAACPNCPKGHLEEVIVREASDGRLRYFVSCPKSLRVEIPPARLQLWAVRFEELIRKISITLSLRGRLRVLEAGRLWRLGKTKWQGRSRDVLFARGLSWPDAREIAGKILRAIRPIVLVPDQVPEDSLWTKRMPAVVALSQVSQIWGGDLEIDHEDLFVMVHDQDEAQPEACDDGPSPKERRLALRRAVKSEIQSLVMDEALVAAYVQHGSYRKAATALSQETNQIITKDKVYRAVQRKGGLTAVSRGTSSNSVRRTVASQRRDGKKKIPNAPEAVDWQ